MTPPGRHRRQRHLHLIVGIVVVAALVLVNGAPIVAFAKSSYHSYEINRMSYKRKYGHWTNIHIPADRRVNAVHAVMLNTGKVLIMAGSGNDIGNFNAGRFESLVYNPADNTFKKIKTPYDMFCSGHFILPNGDVLIAGGTSRYEVLASQVHYAAGVMTVVNRSTTKGAVLPAGTVFASTANQLYRSTAKVTVLPARQVRERVGTRMKEVTYPTYTPLWVKARATGAGPVSKVDRPYAIEGLPKGLVAHLRASAFSITLDEQNYWGTRKSYIFDPYSETYKKVSDMNLARWYPTLVGLKDGNVLAVSGLDQFGRWIQGHSEIFSLKTQEWKVDPRLKKSFPTYPSLYLMPDGDLFFTGASSGYGPDTSAVRTPGIWNPVTNAFRPVTGMRDPNLLETAGSVLLPPAQRQRYAIIGGGGVGQSNASTGRIDIVDLDSKDPRWHAAGSLPEGTRYPEIVITPTDGVVISGGSRDYRGMHGSDIMKTFMMSPSSGMLMEMANPLVGRDYHSEGLLLPSGKILTLGGNPLFGNKQDTEPEVFRQQITVYSPPYLFHGARPTLTGGPTQMRRGETADFATPDAGDIVKARLMHPSAVTHVTDVQQRSIALTLVPRAGSVALTIPRGAGLVPAGWYMVFVDSRAGVPSVARWVHVS
jgi:hypothetical protein